MGKSKKSQVQAFRVFKNKTLIPLYQQAKHREALRHLKNYCETHSITETLDTFINSEFAFLYYHIGQTKKAIQLYREALQENKACINALQFLSRILAGEKNKDAIHLARAAYFINPNFVQANNLVYIYGAVGDYKNSLEWHKKTLKLAKRKSDQCVVKANLAFFYDHHGNKQAAKRIARQVINNPVMKQKKYIYLIKKLREIIK